MVHQHAVVIGCAGTQLESAEAALFARYPPMGVILFKRNINDPDQVRKLIADLKNASGWDVPIWIDQEGGRVQRFRAPHWQNYPAMQHFADAYDQDATQGLAFLDTATRLLSGDLCDLGVDVDCHPVLDLRFPETHNVIGNRSFARMPETVVACGQTVITALQQSAIVPIMKHFPGHGRAQSDSHLELPVVTASLTDILDQDVAPFIALQATPMVMTAHIVYPEWDEMPATLSRRILSDFWRNEIGYQGLIVSDDLDMKALSEYGSPSELLRQTLSIGADLALYCTGNYEQNAVILAAAPKITDRAMQAWQICEDIRQKSYSAPSSEAINHYQQWAETLV